MSTSLLQILSSGSVRLAICLSLWTRSFHTSQIDVPSPEDESIPRIGAIHLGTCITTITRQRRKGVHQVKISGLRFHKLINKATAIMLDGPPLPEGNNTSSQGQSQESSASTANEAHNEPDVTMEGAGDFLDIDDFFQEAIPSTSVGTKLSRNDLECRGIEGSYVSMSSPTNGSPPVTVLELSKNHTSKATPMYFVGETSQGKSIDTCACKC